MKKSDTPFYLTGGTALSRGYFNHRYSDDLDLFMNQRDDYSQYVQLLLHEFEYAEKFNLFSIDYKHLQKYENFTQFVLIKKTEHGEVTLKIDLVNDIAVHYGNFKQDLILGTLDSWQNILSNKISAVFRYEAKDIVDIWIIAKYMQFDWIPVIEQAKTKEAATDPVVIFNILKSFPLNELTSIKWIISMDFAMFRKELDQIAEDILRGNNNSFAI